MNWVPLGEVMELAYGKSLSAKHRVPGSIPVYGSNGVVGTQDKPLVEGKSVIVGRKGSAGAVRLVTEPCFPIDTTYFVRPRKGIHLSL